MLKQPNATTNGTDPLDQHRPECEPEKFIIREPYGIEVMHNAGQDEQQIQIMCARILAVVDGSPSGRVTFSEIVRNGPRKDWRAACRRLVDDKVLDTYHPTDAGDNGVFWRHQPRRRQGRLRGTRG